MTKFKARTVTERNTVYVSTEDVAEYLRTLGSTEDTDVRNRIEQAAKNIEALEPNIIERLARVIKEDEIQQWLDKENEDFGCKPRELIGTSRELELEIMLHRIASDEPS